MPRDYGYRFEVYQDRRREWRWRLLASNANIVAEGGEGYATAYGARRAVESVRAKVAAAAMPATPGKGV